jgi:flagellar biosynthesis/type III secretory pathway M-ring protein FliF/YscJ
MQLLMKSVDQVSVQVLSDALEAAGIAFRVDNAGISSLMPLPGLFEARVMVEADDLAAAERILADLGMADD